MKAQLTSQNRASANKNVIWRWILFSQQLLQDTQKLFKRRIAQRIPLLSKEESGIQKRFISRIRMLTFSGVQAFVVRVYYVYAIYVRVYNCGWKSQRNVTKKHRKKSSNFRCNVTHLAADGAQCSGRVEGAVDFVLTEHTEEGLRVRRAHRLALRVTVTVHERCTVLIAAQWASTTCSCCTPRRGQWCTAWGAARTRCTSGPPPSRCPTPTTRPARAAHPLRYNERFPVRPQPLLTQSKTHVHWSAKFHSCIFLRPLAIAV